MLWREQQLGAGRKELGRPEGLRPQYGVDWWLGATTVQEGKVLGEGQHQQLTGLQGRETRMEHHGASVVRSAAALAVRSLTSFWMSMTAAASASAAAATAAAASAIGSGHRHVQHQRHFRPGQSLGLLSGLAAATAARGGELRRQPRGSAGRACWDGWRWGDSSRVDQARAGAAAGLGNHRGLSRHGEDAGKSCMDSRGSGTSWPS